MDSVLRGQSPSQNNKVPFVKLQKDWFWRFISTGCSDKATLYTIFQNVKQSEKDVLIGQNKVVTRSNILGGAEYQKTSWKLLPTQTQPLADGDMNSGQKHQKGITRRQSEQKATHYEGEPKFRKELLTQGESQLPSPWAELVPRTA